MNDPRAHDPKLEECIQNCSQCHAICIETVAYCLEQGGKHADPQHIALMSVCADICATSANAMLRGAEVHAVTCRACADICKACAESCAAMDDEVMRRCAEACRRCAETCGAMAA